MRGPKKNLILIRLIKKNHSHLSYIFMYHHHHHPDSNILFPFHINIYFTEMSQFPGIYILGIFMIPFCLIRKLEYKLSLSPYCCLPSLMQERKFQCG